jgi:hypothetical protein
VVVRWWVRSQSSMAVVISGADGFVEDLGLLHPRMQFFEPE